MIGTRPRIALVGVLMLAAASLAFLLKPSNLLTGYGTKPNLDLLIPKQFAEWQIDKSVVPVALPAELQATQDAVYDQTLVRTYVNRNGDRIMLTIAYGGNQSRQLQVHRPEVCYSALGFQILSKRKINISVLPGSNPIPAMQLVAKQGWRNEPITYWIRIGDQLVRGNLELGFARVSIGLRGYIADGVLFRVSSISNDNQKSFEQQATFVRDLMASLDDKQRRILIAFSAPHT